MRRIDRLIERYKAACLVITGQWYVDLLCFGYSWPIVTFGISDAPHRVTLWGFARLVRRTERRARLIERRAREEASRAV